MAFGNWRDYLRGLEEVSLKEYLYVFRPLLACRWIERQLGQVPMLFAQLVGRVLDEPTCSTARKQAGDELAHAAGEALSRFIAAKPLKEFTPAYSAHAAWPIRDWPRRNSRKAAVTRLSLSVEMEEFS